MPKLRVAGFCAAVWLAGVMVSLLAATPAADGPLVAHEWGTFTALQDDDGTALGSINSDDEPVPGFVCRIGGFRNSSALSQMSPGLAGAKGVTPCHPDVTMRLETPVIYFYPSEKGGAATANVHVTFRGGWLTEFYPPAKAEAPDLENAHTFFPPITSATSGGLAWNGLELGATGELTPTDDPVWTTPREVARAAVVKAPPSAETDRYSPNRPEKFLFYRGVGHLDSPLRVVRDKNTDLLSIYPNPGSVGTAADLRVPAAWLLEIRPEDGFCAFRPVEGALNLGAPTGRALASLPASFPPEEFSAVRLQELRATMKGALVAAGLFPDEAAAMLKTWELSYFKSPGRRLFYITPNAWTNRVLPLTIDGAKITRAMIGRIELITPTQRERLARIAAGPCPEMETIRRAYFKETKFALPAIYQDYLDLGRFRDALVLDEQRRQPTAALEAFVTANYLRPR